MSEEYKCPICGEPTFKFYGNYRKDKLCSAHATALKKGEIEILNQIETLGGTYSDETIFINNENGKILNKYLDNDISEVLKKCYNDWPKNDFDRCIICNKNSNGYAFCRDCFKTNNFLTLQNKLFEIQDKQPEHKETENLLKILNELDKLQKNTTNENKESNTNISNQNKKEDIAKTQSQEEIINDNQSNNTVIINEKNKSKCITCGRQTDGLLFCTFCYQKYKNKELLFKITNCSNVELLDESYEGRYTCPDGHIVKSKSERDIDRYLFEKNIPHAYEIELSYGPSEKDVLHPDFFLPHYLGQGKHVYIEHWGYNENNISYTNTKKFKMPIYKELGITLICTDEKKDASKIDAVLDRKLNKAFIKENQINFDNED